MNNEWPLWPTFFLEIVIYFRETKFILIIYIDWTCAWTIFWGFSDLTTIFYYLSKQHKFWKMVHYRHTFMRFNFLFSVTLIGKTKSALLKRTRQLWSLWRFKFFWWCLCYDIEFSFWVIFIVIKFLRDKV